MTDPNAMTVLIASNKVTSLSSASLHNVASP